MPSFFTVPKTAVAVGVWGTVKTYSCIPHNSLNSISNATAPVVEQTDEHIKKAIDPQAVQQLFLCLFF